MIAVALLALVMGSMVLCTRSIHFTEVAKDHERNATTWASDILTGGDAEGRKLIMLARQPRVRYYRSLQRKYEHLVFHPWEIVPPDPPPP
jgi:hypothetical protein